MLGVKWIPHFFHTGIGMVLSTQSKKSNFWFAFCFSVPPRQPTEDGGGIGSLQQCTAQTKQKNESEKEREKGSAIKRSLLRNLGGSFIIPKTTQAFRPVEWDTNTIMFFFLKQMCFHKHPFIKNPVSLRMFQEEMSCCVFSTLINLSLFPHSLFGGTAFVLPRR